MNLMILINGALMFYRNFGLRHVSAAFGFANGLAAPNGGQKVISGTRKCAPKTLTEEHTEI
jgi:hypothetical protein